MRPLFATIDSAALKHNYAVVRRHAPRSWVLAVVKANAYGHGLLRTAKALAEADGFALLELDEAVRCARRDSSSASWFSEGFLCLRTAFSAGAHVDIVVHHMDQVAALDRLPVNRQARRADQANTS